MCSVCTKIFWSFEDLQRHLSVHTVEKSHACPKCTISFPQSSHLRSHFRVHTGEKRYSCPQCSKSFAQSSRLQLRLRNHTGEKPFICFVQNRSLGLISSKIISTQVSAADPLIVKMILLWILVSIQIFAHETSVHPPILFFKIIRVLITLCFIFQNKLFQTTVD